jgi:hypothetical protein
LTDYFLAAIASQVRKLRVHVLHHAENVDQCGAVGQGFEEVLRGEGVLFE